MADNPLLAFLIFENTRALRRQRVFRDRMNAFELSESMFIELFRLPKPLVMNLCDELREELQPATARRTALSVESKVLVALRFFAQGSYQRSVGQDFTLAVSQRCVSHNLRQVCSAINSKLLAKYVKFPRSNEEQAKVKQGFYEKHSFPGIIGAVDGTLVAIVPPTAKEGVREDLFLGRKGYHCINVQLVCDSQLQILNVNARFPGATHDSFIWKYSSLRQALENDFQNGRRNAWLIGDSDYPLEPWLLKPCKDPKDCTPEERYNKIHCKARNCIERCNGVLKQRFRCLLKHRVLHYSPTTAALIINACCVLHNICMKNNVPLPSDTYEDDADEENSEHNDECSELRNVAEQIRKDLIRRHFS